MPISDVVKIMGKYKKWAICLGYSGRNYYGMQRQSCGNKVIDTLPTIESELLTAFHTVELISENELNTPNLMHFQRAARTDKGVSAIKQIITMNVLNAYEVNTYIDKLNQLLPKEIRIFGAKKATTRFDAKNFCDARTYSYLLPTFALSCLEEGTSPESFCLPSEELARFNSLLSLFVGTRNFHNFTSQKKPTDPSARRFILSFDCSPPFSLKHEDTSLEFVTIRVKGQSFMLHQIRKMIGITIAVMRGLTDVSTINRCFEAARLDVPMAPGLGLLLEQVHYEKYNKRYGGDGIHEPLLWDEHNDQIDKFKHTFIYPQIVETEITENSMLNWLQTLPLHCFDVRSNHVNGHKKEDGDGSKTQVKLQVGDNLDKVEDENNPDKAEAVDHLEEATTLDHQVNTDQLDDEEAPNPNKKLKTV